MPTRTLRIVDEMPTARMAVEDAVAKVPGYSMEPGRVTPHLYAVLVAADRRTVIAVGNPYVGPGGGPGTNYGRKATWRDGRVVSTHSLGRSRSYGYEYEQHAAKLRRIVARWQRRGFEIVAGYCFAGPMG